MLIFIQAFSFFSVFYPPKVSAHIKFIKYEILNMTNNKKPLKALAARFTHDQYDYIKSHVNKSVLLRELLQAHIEQVVANEES